MATWRRRVIWTEAGRQSVDDVVAYIARDSPQGASRVLNAVLELAQSLADLPMRGRVVPEIGEESVREVFDDRIEIMWLLHAARDFERWRRGDQR